MPLIGLFNRKEKKVNYKHIDNMYKSIEYLPHYDYQEINNNNLLIRQLKNKINSEIIFNENSIFLFEGSIYNREDFNYKLKDSEIVFELFLKYGKNSLDHLIGKFYFLFFDINKNTLFIARDNQGYTSINYYIDNNFFIFSSNINAILSLDIINKEINENKIIGILSVWQANNYETSYKNISILPPSYYIEVDNDKFVKKKYWFPEKININYKYKNDYEYSEELFFILNNSIKGIINTRKNIASMLSGGFDSSTVSVLSANLLKEKNYKLKTYSHIAYYNTSKSKNLSHRILDEKDNILDIVNFNKNIQAELINSKDIPLIKSIIKFLNISKLPIHGAINLYWILDIFEKSKDNDILLSGEHGNSSISLVGLDYLLSFRRLINIFGLKRAILKKFFKRFVFYDYKYIKEKFLFDKYIEKNSYLKNEFISKNNIKNNIKEFINEKYSFYTNQEFAMKILNSGSTSRTYIGGLLSEYYNIEFADPTADKRVIEYILSIPNDFFFDKNGIQKNIIRTMMKDLLPISILNTKKKGLQAGDIGYRFFNDRNEIKYYLEEFKKVDLIKSIIDIEKLEKDIEFIIKNAESYNFDNIRIGVILRTFMTLYFIYTFYTNEV